MRAFLKKYRSLCVLGGVAVLLAGAVASSASPPLGLALVLAGLVLSLAGLLVGLPRPGGRRDRKGRP